jgi:hypothetical protein
MSLRLNPTKEFEMIEKAISIIPKPISVEDKVEELARAFIYDHHVMWAYMDQHTKLV